MPVIVSEPEGGSFAPAPEGLHQAVCVDVVDRGILDTSFGPKHKVDIIWQVVPFEDDGQEQRDEEGRRFQVMQRYTASLHEKALLFQHLKAWRGKPFTEEQLKGFDLDTVIGANCQIQVVHNIGSNKKVYANVQAIVPLGKKTDKIRATEDYVRAKDRVKHSNGAAHEAQSGADADEEGLPF